MKTRVMKVNSANLSEGFILNLYSVRVKLHQRWDQHSEMTFTSSGDSSSQLVLGEHEILPGTGAVPLC